VLIESIPFATKATVDPGRRLPFAFWPVGRQIRKLSRKRASGKLAGTSTQALRVALMGAKPRAKPRHGPI